MRKDMYKVIVERPRRGGGYRSEAPIPADLDDSPKQEGLKRRHRSRKCLNENLRPLERYLASQVGRPWDKVYSEISAGIDRRNTVQRHIHQHLEDFVETRAVADGDTILVWNGRLGYEPVGNLTWLRFYVDPRTGLLCLNRQGARKKRAIRLQQKIEHLIRLKKSHGTGIVIDDSTQLHMINGIWYRITLAKVARSRYHGIFDKLRGLPACSCPDIVDAGGIPSNLTLFGRTGVYAADKQQVSVRELRARRLVNAVC